MSKAESIDAKIHRHRRTRLPDPQEIAFLISHMSYCLVWMEVVGDRAVWADDGVEIPASLQDYVVYRRSELEELYATRSSVQPGEWKTIHAAKKAGLQIVKGGAGK